MLLLKSAGLCPHHQEMVCRLRRGVRRVALWALVVVMLFSPACALGKLHACGALSFHSVSTYFAIGRFHAEYSYNH
jgi:hypothetical protein